MADFIEWVKGLTDNKKTYLVGAAIGLLAFAEYVGWISPDNRTAVLTALGGLGLMTARAAIQKSGRKP